MIHDALLNIASVSVGYGAVPLFENLELKLDGGEFVCFMGPNGIGKSTLIRTITGLQNPLAGQITIAGKSSSASTVAVVLTDRITPHNMTVQELITLGRYPYLSWNIRLSQEDQKIIDRAIQQVNIGDLRTRKVHELSDGQLQLVMIARALAQNTPVIILDEPTAHLDLNNRLEIMKLLRKIAHQNNKGILASTHDLDLALQTADRIWLTGQHRNIVTGIPEDLVLNNAFDSIFQLKGFDLKTGRVMHEGVRGKSLNLVGEGYSFRWTKNALERNGFTIDSNNSNTVFIQSTENRFRWIIDQHEFESLALLLDHLKSH